MPKKTNNEHVDSNESKNALKSEQQEKKVKAKDQKRDLLKLQYKTKEEISEMRINLADSMKNIKMEIEKAKLNERKLRQEMKSTTSLERNEAKKERIRVQHEINKQKDLVKKNKVILAKKKQELAQKIKLQDQQQKNTLLENKKSWKNQIHSVKDIVKTEKLKQKAKLLQEKNKIKNEKLKLKKENHDKKIGERDKLYLERERLNDIKVEILETKKTLIAKQKEARLKQRSEKASRIDDAKKQKVELQRLKKEELEKYKLKKLKLRRTLMIKRGANQAEIEKIQTEINDLKSSSQAEIFKSRQETELELAKKNNSNLESYEALVENTEDINDIKNQEKTNPLREVHDEMQKSLVDVTFEKAATDAGGSKEELIRGAAIVAAGRHGLKLYKKYNSDASKLQLSKVKLPSETKELIEEFRDLKANNRTTDIREFAKYASFLTGDEFTPEQITTQFMHPVIACLRGRVVATLGGYFTLKKIRGYSIIEYKDASAGAMHNVVSPTESEYQAKLEEVIMDKLKKGLVIQVAPNIGLKYDGGIKVMHDLPFLKR